MVDQNEEGTHTNVTCPVRFRLLKKYWTKSIW